MKPHATTYLKYNWAVMVAALILFAAQQLGFAQNLQTETQVVSLASEGPSNQAELEQFLDQFFTEKMRQSHIPGLVFVLVKGHEIIFSKGYGLANIENKNPVIPNITIFRVGSISKLFTATAVMQLYERGLLNLNDDVNQYLNLFKIEDEFESPVTIAHLLTHTAGFAERFIGMAARQETELVTMSQYLADRMPPRFMPPGQIYSYSNHGILLAGYLVEIISGKPFAQYIYENILQPLDMDRSSFSLPLQFGSDLAVGYEYIDNGYRPFAFDYLNMIAPAGSLNSTATDMAHFMIAHLQNGRYADKRILQEATAREMHRQHFTHHLRLPGSAYGFYEHFENNQRAILHDGDWRGFSSRIFLIPERSLGFFVAYNATAPTLRAELVSQFLDRYFPGRKKAPTAGSPKKIQNGVERYTGSYRWDYYTRHSFAKIVMLVQQVRVTVGKGGNLMLHAFGDQLTPYQYREIEPLVFEQIDEDGYLTFREDDKRQITHLFTSLLGVPVAFERLAWFESTAFQVYLIGVFSLIFLSPLIVWPIGNVTRRLFKKPSQAIHKVRHARALAALVSFLNLTFLVGICLALMLIQFELVYGLPISVTVLLGLPLLSSLLTIGLVAMTFRVWKNKYWGVMARVYYALITLAALVFIPFLHYWNLLGFRF